MQTALNQLRDFPWFYDAERDAVERMLAAPLVARGSCLVRPCASRRALAISYKRELDGSLVHTRVRLDGGEWRVEETERAFSTVNKLVQSLTLKPLSR